MLVAVLVFLALVLCAVGAYLALQGIADEVYYACAAHGDPATYTEAQESYDLTFGDASGVDRALGDALASELQVPVALAVLPFLVGFLFQFSLFRGPLSWGWVGWHPALRFWLSVCSGLLAWTATWTWLSWGLVAVAGTEALVTWVFLFAYDSCLGDPGVGAFLALPYAWYYLGSLLALVAVSWAAWRWQVKRVRGVLDA